VRHKAAVEFHTDSAAFWRKQGNQRRAELHTRCAQLEEQLIAVELEWALLVEEETGG